MGVGGAVVQMDIVVLLLQENLGESLLQEMMITVGYYIS